MNNMKKINDDLLRQYISPEKIEKAPEGFTSKVMTHVQLETRHLILAERSWKKNLVPAISAAVTILLIASAFLIPGSHSDAFSNPVLSLFKNLKFSVPEINLNSIFRLTLPSVVMYVFIGIIILTLFDRALNRIFYKEK
jgi:hypothetical protein